MDDLDYRRAADLMKHGLGCNVCVAIGADRDLIHPDRAVRDNGAAYVRHCIDAVRILGGTNVVGPLYSAVGRLWQQTPAERVQDLDLLVAQLTALSDYACDSGAVLCLEPLNRFETSFVNLASQAVEIVDRVNSPACKLLLDTFHMNIEEKSLGDAIRLSGPRLAHVHACENDRGAPGTGHIDWQEVARALRDIDYQGPLVIESFTNQIKTIARAAAIGGRLSHRRMNWDAGVWHICDAWYSRAQGREAPSVRTTRISLGSWAFSFGPFEDHPWSFSKLIRYAANAGYDGVEINGFHPHPHPDVYNTADKCVQLKREITDLGLGISGYAPDFRAVPPSVVTTSAYLAEIGKSLAFCTNMGIEILRVDTVSAPIALDADTYRRRFDHLTTTWRAAAELQGGRCAAGLGI